MFCRKNAKGGGKAKTPVKALVSRPATGKLVARLADFVGGAFFHDLRNMAEYKDRAKCYHGRLSILICGLDYSELDVLFNICQPSIYGRLNSEALTKASIK